MQPVDLVGLMKLIDAAYDVDEPTFVIGALCGAVAAQCTVEETLKALVDLKDKQWPTS